MKMTLTIKNQGAETSWTERYSSPFVTTQAEADAYGKQLVRGYNLGLRPKETPRELVKAEITGVDPYDSWFEQLKRVAVGQFDYSETGADSLDYKAWRDYFEEELTPEQALAADQILPCPHCGSRVTLRATKPGGDHLFIDCDPEKGCSSTALMHLLRRANISEGIAE